jgi:hypothetical protein
MMINVSRSSIWAGTVRLLESNNPAVKRSIKIFGAVRRSKSPRHVNETPRAISGGEWTDKGALRIWRHGNGAHVRSNRIGYGRMADTRGTMVVQRRGLVNRQACDHYGLRKRETDGAGDQRTKKAVSGTKPMHVNT